MTEPPHNAAPRITSSDIDLYCLDCGYNLRGLSGDPRRCPECGHLVFNSMRKYQAKAAHQANLAQPRRAAEAPTSENDRRLPSLDKESIDPDSGEIKPDHAFRPVRESLLAPTQAGNR